jgi:hypothetical protein
MDFKLVCGAMQETFTKLPSLPTAQQLLQPKAGLDCVSAFEKENLWNYCVSLVCKQCIPIPCGSNFYLYTRLQKLSSSDLTWPDVHWDSAIEWDKCASSEQEFKARSLDQSWKHDCQLSEILNRRDFTLLPKEQPSDSLQDLLKELDIIIVSCWISDCNNKHMAMMLAFGILRIALKQEWNYRDPTKLTVLYTYGCYVYAHIVAALCDYGLGQFDNNAHKYGLVQFEELCNWLKNSPIFDINPEIELENLFIASMMQKPYPIAIRNTLARLKEVYGNSSLDSQQVRFYHVSFLLIASALMKASNKQRDFIPLKLDWKPTLIIMDLPRHFQKRVKDLAQSQLKMYDKEDCVHLANPSKTTIDLIEGLADYLCSKFHGNCMNDWSLEVIKDEAFVRKKKKGDKSTFWHTDWFEYNVTLRKKNKPPRIKGDFYTAFIPLNANVSCEGCSNSDISILHPALRVPFGTIAVFGCYVRHGGTLATLPERYSRVSLDFRFRLYSCAVEGGSRVNEVNLPV